jgi:hypothetical protein
VDKATSVSQNLTSATDSSFILRADSWNTIPSWARGRSSVRIQSKASYKTHVAVFNIRHMPTGCGTWPAVWEVGADWPTKGETDIVEGVNGVGKNQFTLHTKPGEYSHISHMLRHADCVIRMHHARRP